MLSYLLYTIVSFLGFLILVIINSKYRALSNINIFLQIPIGIISVRYFFHAISLVYQTALTHSLINAFDILGTMSIVCFYLYIRRLVLKPTNLKISYLHFFSPLFLIVVYLLVQVIEVPYRPIIRMSYAGSAVLIAIFYCIIAFDLINKHVLHRPKDVKSFAVQDQVIYKWALFLFICSCILVLSFSLRVILYNFSDVTKSQSSLLLGSSIIWLVLFIKILMTPKILYGYEILSNKIDAIAIPSLAMESIWSYSETQAITNEKDQRLSPKIIPFLREHFHRIEEATIFNKFLRNGDVSIDDLAQEIKIPSSHISYLFKYHSNESFVDFKKIIRIYDALSLIKNGYLNSQTFESLAVEVGFTSYTSFFLSFRQITGRSPQDYLSSRVR